MAGAQHYPVVTTTVRVRYAETDQMGVVYYANYLVWFEVARGALCRDRGIDYGEMEACGLLLPIVEARVRYRLPARYDDEITLEIRPAELRSRSVRFSYRVLRGDELLADGETLQVLTGTDGRPRALPPDLLARFAGGNPLAERQS
jgi:acyl-CoA thioester hydrolase